MKPWISHFLFQWYFSISGRLRWFDMPEYPSVWPEVSQRILFKCLWRRQRSHQKNITSEPRRTIVCLWLPPIPLAWKHNFEGKEVNVVDLIKPFVYFSETSYEVVGLSKCPNDKNKTSKTLNSKFQMNQVKWNPPQQFSIIFLLFSSQMFQQKIHSVIFNNIFKTSN